MPRRMNLHAPHCSAQCIRLHFCIGAVMALCGSFLLGCETPSSQVETGPLKATVTAQVGMLEIGLSIDENGHIALSSGLTPKMRINLGPVSLQFSIDKSIEIAQAKPFQLIVLRQDQSGNIEQSQYEVGQKFELNFRHQEWVSQIKRENDSILVVVESSALPVSSNLVATNPESTGQSSSGDAPGEVHASAQEAQEAQERYAETPETLDPPRALAVEQPQPEAAAPPPTFNPSGGRPEPTTPFNRPRLSPRYYSQQGSRPTQGRPFGHHHH
jgi:hypothetical protein